MSSNYANSVFPSVDLTIEVDGVRFAYAFTMTVYAYAATEYSYANASLSAAAYREGELVIDGKNRRVVVVDCNSNGRYDDQSGIDDSVRLADGTVYPKIGDMLYVIDPEAKVDGYANPYDPSSNDALHYVAKQVNLGGRFRDLKITPAGDELTLEPSPIPVGYVTNSNTGYRAIVYGEQGFLKVVGDESGKAPLPAGEWRLASYTINKTSTDEPPPKASPGRIPVSISRAADFWLTVDVSTRVYHGQRPCQTGLSGSASHGGPDGRAAVRRAVPPRRRGRIS